jgi:CRP/FNR family transcriptional regulator
LQDRLADIVNPHGRIVRLPKGAHPFRAGDEARDYLIVRDGVVRVQLTAESGREIVLYRVGANEGCVLTTSSLLARQPYSAEAICESDVTALLVPGEAFRRLLSTDPGFRDFVLSTYAARVADLILLMEETAFRGVARRLARSLLHRAELGVVSLTHQALAVEIGTAREVVSRHLKEFERRGVLRAHRGSIEIADRNALEAIAE